MKGWVEEDDVQVIEEFVIYMVTCRGKPSPTTPFYGLTVGTSIKKYNTITFSLCIVYFVCWTKISEFVFCKKGGGGGRGRPTYRKKSSV